MNITKKIYSKILAVNSRETSKICTNTVRREMISTEALIDNSSLIDGSENAPDIIVSLATYSTRVHEIFCMLQSLARQTLKPKKVYLWLDENEYNDNTIPLSLKRFMDRGLTIKYAKNLKSYNKLIHTLKLHPTSAIITLDDDFIYPHDLIERLLSAHNQQPNDIICMISRVIKTSNNQIRPYSEWHHNTQKKHSNICVLPLGGSGTLYPPGSFHKDIMNEKLFTNLAPTADDLWFRAMTLINNKKVLTLLTFKEFAKLYTSLENGFNQPLSSYNLVKRQNDIQFDQILQKYPEIKKTLLQNC